MCGISGFISDKNYIKKNSINSTLDLMGRRGPDAKNYYIEDNSSNKFKRIPKIIGASLSNFSSELCKTPSAIASSKRSS